MRDLSELVEKILLRNTLLRVRVSWLVRVRRYRPEGRLGWRESERRVSCR